MATKSKSIALRNSGGMTTEQVRDILVNSTTKILELTANTVLARGTLPITRGSGGGLDVNPTLRNLDFECHYIEGEPSPLQYRAMFDQEGSANRIVAGLPDECWSLYPELYETEDDRITQTERQWKELEETINPWHYLHRLNVQARINRFGAMLIGLDDGIRDLSIPAFGFKANGEFDLTQPEKRRKVTFFRPFSEENIQIDQLEPDVNNPRYGQPKFYTFKVADPNSTIAPGSEAITTDLKVHWTRVFHYAEGLQGSPYAGTPTLRNLHRRVYDIRKILGSSGEMFYKGGFPGISFEAYPELVAAGATLDTKSLKKEIEAYAAGIQRYLQLVGMTAKSLAPQVADPTNHLLAQYMYVCATIRMPFRIFMGSEAGHLASEQDILTWNGRVTGHQKLEIDPMMIKPFVHRLVGLRCLKKPDRVMLAWADRNSLTDSQRAEVAVKKAQALLQYVTSGSQKLIPPKYFLTLVMGMTAIESVAIMDKLGGEEKVMKDLEELVQATAGDTPASSGKSSAASTGASGKRNSKAKKTKPKKRT